MKKLVTSGLLLATFIIGVYAGEKPYFRILGKKDGEYVIQGAVAPVLGVVQVSGEPLPEKGSLNCEWKTEHKKLPQGDEIPYLVGYCENGVVIHLTGLDLNH